MKGICSVGNIVNHLKFLPLRMVWSPILSLLIFTSVVRDVFTSESMNNELPSQAPSLSLKCKNDTLDSCWNKIPPFPDQGIPSSEVGVNASCHAFETGMMCVHNWSRRCLGEEARKKIVDSVRGAHEAFAFLCKDTQFRKEFLSHSSCYKKISTYWDDCAHKFISTLKSLRPAHYENPKNLCCIRRNFLRCVSQVSTHHCSEDATKFLLRMAETLVRTTLRGNSPQADKCDNNPEVLRHCDMQASSPSLQGSNHFIPIFLISVLSLHGIGW